MLHMWNIRPLKGLLYLSWNKLHFRFCKWPIYLVKHYTVGSVNSRVIRRAKVEDYHVLMKFGEQHQGTDFFSHYFYRWVCDQNYQPFVVLEKNEIVGFLLCQVIDGGEGVVYSAGRVAFHFRQKGYIKILTSHIENYLQEQMPQVKYVKIVFDDENLHKIGPNYLREGHVVMSKKLVYSVLFDFSEMINLHQSEHVLQPLKSEHLKQLFGCGHLIERICPENHLFIKYLPYKPVASNIPLITGTYHRVFASSPTSSVNTSKHLDKTACLNENKTDIVSFAQFYVGEIGLCCCVDIAAARDVSLTSLQNIITRNLQEISYLTEKRGVLSLSFNENISLDQVMTCLDRHGVSKLMPGMESVQFHLLQKLLPKDK